MEPTDELEAPDRRIPESRVARLAKRPSVSRPSLFFLANPPGLIVPLHHGLSQISQPFFMAQVLDMGDQHDAVAGRDPKQGNQSDDRPIDSTPPDTNTPAMPAMSASGRFTMISAASEPDPKAAARMKNIAITTTMLNHRSKDAAC
jgi:hypothetical protein